MDKNTIAMINEEMIAQKCYSAVVNAIEDATDKHSASNYITNNSDSGFFWDSLNTFLAESFVTTQVEYSKVKVGVQWEAILYYHPISNLIFLLVKEYKIKDMLRTKPDENPQYIRSLLFPNKELEPEVQQMNLFDDGSNPSDSEDSDSDFRELCSGFPSIKMADLESTRFAIVSFSISHEQVTSLKCWVLNKQFQKVQEKDWMDLITPEITIPFKTEESDSNSFVKLKHKKSPKDTSKEDSFVASKDKADGEDKQG